MWPWQFMPKTTEMRTVIRSTVVKKCRFWWTREIRSQMEASMAMQKILFGNGIDLIRCYHSFSATGPYRVPRQIVGLPRIIVVPPSVAEGFAKIAVLTPLVILLIHNRADVSRLKGSGCLAWSTVPQRRAQASPWKEPHDAHRRHRRPHPRVARRPHPHRARRPSLA
jgi:hypothetical protein